MPSFVERIAKSALSRAIKRGVDKVLDKIFENKKKHSKKDSPLKTESPQTNSKIKKTHPWRLCPIGEHWISEHNLSVPQSNKGPAYKTIRRGHCRMNLSKHEFYTAQELQEIARLHFESLRNDPEAMPIPDALDFPHGNDYDLSIAGWTKFWNETLNPENPVTPDFIKVLISTESSFEVWPDTKSKVGPARGLIQITEMTRKILQDAKGELRDHLISLSVEESRETEANIAAGIRWLYHKRFLLERRINRKVSWEEAAAEYKGIFGQISKHERSDRIMNEMKDRHSRLLEQRKKTRKSNHED
jgi:hypothetical protein